MFTLGCLVEGRAGIKVLLTAWGGVILGNFRAVRCVEKFRKFCGKLASY